MPVGDFGAGEAKARIERRAGPMVKAKKCMPGDSGGDSLLACG